ncbi:hypothetical protein L598_001500000760 [Mesorhizobium sp. J18]|nr:hypothetical protein L598_001500000760 [Mesorhizobium sp. J18]
MRRNSAGVQTSGNAPKSNVRKIGSNAQASGNSVGRSFGVNFVANWVETNRRANGMIYATV